VEISEPQTSIRKELDYDQLFPDSIWTEYMTRRGDYLSLIAYNEYNNANEWRRIYQWNREHWEEKGIGPDRDNPNFIYPYRELDLKKPAKEAIEWAYDHYIHVVASGETLWTIAKKEYGDELAWVVLFWDNEELLNSQDGKLIPGLKLKVRSELWPEVE
jgi:nucleoid-associated protein YgaU